MTAVLTALLTGCSVNEEGIMGGFPYLEIEVATKSISKVGSSDVIAVKSNRPMTVEVTAGVSWLRANVSGEQLVLEWDDNELEFTREAVVTVSTSNNLVSKDVTVVQDASGEVTIMGDLILHSKAEIASNTYTKTTDNLIIGNVTSIETKSASGEVHTVFDGRKLTASPTDISDADLSLLEEQIHMVGEKGLAVINTNATTLPCGLIAANGIERVNFEYNSMSVLNSAEQLSALGLKELSLKGNKVADISSLSGCTAMEYLDLTGNEVSDLEPLKSMTGLKKIVLTDLPLTYALLDVFRDLYSVEIVADSVRAEDSPLPVFGDMEITEVSDKEVQLKVKITGNATGLGKTGFYIGRSRNIKEMKYHDAAVSNGVLTLTYNPETLYNRIYYVRAYAENAKGAGYSDSDSFGSVVSEEDVYIGSEDDIAQLQAKGYSHVNASVIVGDRTGSNNDGVHLNDGKYDIYFKEHSFADLSFFSQFANIRDGLYIGNAGLASLDVISHIKGIQTLWLKGNRISSMPVMKSYETLKSLDVSMNNISDFAFLANMPVLERLYLGSSEAPAKETNEIGVLTGLDKYKNLKYIDLSGLPIHEWQVEDLRALMPETEIVFTSGGRDPFIPTVMSKGIASLEGATELKGVVSGNGGTPVTEYGFYFGKDMAALKKIKVGSSIETGAEFNYEVAVPDEDTYYFYPYAINSYGESRCDIYDFSYAPINLSKYGTSNCYMVSHPGKYIFDASVKGNSIEPVGAISSAEVLWETLCSDSVVNEGDIITSVGIMSQFVIFEVPEVFTPGNALIAVKDASGNVLWSWHIWITDYDPYLTSQTYSSGSVMMDRNLGALNAGTTATAYGLLYQWGRKDPFVNAGDVKLTEYAMTYPEDAISFIFSTESNDNLEFSIQNPTTVVDNITWNKSAELWQEDKTIYDPCPLGWKVPEGGPGAWHNFDSLCRHGERGVWFDEPLSVPAAYYPNAGFTDGNNILRDGNSAHYWSYTSRESHAYNFCINWRGLPNELSNKDNLFSIRCERVEQNFKVKTLAIVSESGSTIIVKGAVEVEMNCPILEKGFVISSLSKSPTVEDNDKMVTHADAGTGIYECTVTGLKSSVRYYIRAYAIGETGVKYGDVIEFAVKSSGSGEGFTGDDFEL